MLSCWKNVVEKRGDESPDSPFKPNNMYEPLRQVLDFRHIEQINTMVFHFRELSRQVTSNIGVVQNTIVGQLRSLNERIADNIEFLEEDMARNERAPFEAKLEYYRQEYLDMKAIVDELVVNPNNNIPSSSQ